MNAESGTPRAERRSRPPAPEAVVRQYEPRDREAVREICRRTAYRNRGSAAVFEDGELFADYWVSYYTDHEPESTWVLEQDGQVIGYLSGCVDTRRHKQVMARSIVPAVVGKAIWRLVTGRYRQRTTKRMLWWMVSRGFREEPKFPYDRYPAHFHINLLRQAYGRGNFHRLAQKFLERLEELGVERIHAQAEEPADGGGWGKTAVSFGRQMDQVYEFYAESPSTFQQYVLGVDKPMVNRVWGATLPAYREWIAFTAGRYQM
jgi:L-amino acid N-acyltransferase YncA